MFAEFFCDRKSDLLPQKARLNTDFSVYINGLYLDVEFRGILRAAAAGGRTMNFVPIKIKWKKKNVSLIGEEIDATRKKWKLNDRMANQLAHMWGSEIAMNSF